MKRMMVHLLAAMFSLSAVVGYEGTADAGAASDVVKSRQTALYELLKQSGTANQKKVSSVFDEMIDYQALAEASLGAEWAARSNAERSEYTGLLKQLVQNAYERHLKKTLNSNIDYVSEKSEGASIVVATKAVSKTGAREEPIETKFKMHEKNGAWRVTDIVTQGVSLVSSYRAQFTKIVKKDGFAALIKKMKDTLAKGEE